MNSQDITRALIDTTVARAMVEMDADPKRSVRQALRSWPPIFPRPLSESDFCHFSGSSAQR